MIFNLDKYGTANVFGWTHDHLIKVLTTGHNRIVRNIRLIKALKAIKREDFVPEKEKENSYMDKEVEIDYGQQITRPTVSAYMLELLSPKVGSRVLEIGTGSGWTTALIGYIIGNLGKVISLEKYQYIANFARENIRKYPELKNIEIIFKNGKDGLAQRAPFDSIFVSAAFKEMPENLKLQLNIGGRLIAPIEEHKLILIERESVDKWNEKYFEAFIEDKIEEGVS